MQRWTPDEGRFAELMLYVSMKCADSKSFGATKLNKVLFYSDFLAYAMLGKPITGFDYQKLEHGPAPRQIVKVRERLESEGALCVKTVAVQGDRTQLRPIALREPHIEQFSPEELAVVDRVIATLKDSSAEQVSDLSHMEIGWKAARLHETIPYGTIYLSDTPMGDQEIARIQQFANAHGYSAR